MKRKCWKCGVELKRDEMEEHHLLPESLFNDENLADRFRILLCESCHKEATDKFTEDGVIWMPGSKNIEVVG